MTTAATPLNLVSSGFHLLTNDELKNATRSMSYHCKFNAVAGFIPTLSLCHTFITMEPPAQPFHRGGPSRVNQTTQSAQTLSHWGLIHLNLHPSLLLNPKGKIRGFRVAE